jgi:hypothetical protein
LFGYQKKELPMGIIAKVSTRLQRLLGPCAAEAATESGVIVRQRKFTSLSLARTFVLGFLQDPNASDEALAQMAVQCGADVTPQAVEQRHSPKLVRFLESLFRRASQLVFGSHRALAPLLRRFTSVTVLDSSTITLPDSQHEQFAGCGGSHGRGSAAMKLQTELDLRSGAVQVSVEAGRSADGTSPRQLVRRGVGALRITDLGYFSLAVFATLGRWGEYFLSRLQFGTSVHLAAGVELDVLRWLGRQAGPWIDQAVVLGKEQPLPCRLIAWRVPPEQAARRRQKVREELRRKKGREPSVQRLAWCDWTLLITNVPEELLTAAEAVVLYRARWQVELLFKRWKSQDRVAVLSGATQVRQMVRVWARLLAALVQHWLVIASAWGDARKSLSKVCEAVRGLVGRLAADLQRGRGLQGTLADLDRIIAKTCRRDKRSKPGTFELLNDVNLLHLRLT